MSHLHPSRKEPPLPSVGREDIKKILTAKKEHERFLEKLGIVADETGLLDEPSLGPPPLAGLHHPQAKSSDGKDNTGTQTNGLSGPYGGIPWRKKSPKTSSLIERSHLYETFDKISIEPPETPSLESLARLIQTGSVKRIKSQKHLLFADIREHRHAAGPYSLVEPKVDSGLAAGRPNPHAKYEPQALTIGPKTQKILAGPPQESTAAAKRAAKIASISARLHKGGSTTSRSRSRTQYPPVNQWGQLTPFVSPNGHDSHIAKDKTTRVGFSHPNIPKDALLLKAQQKKYLNASSSSGTTAKTNPYYTGERDQIQIIHARAMANLSPSLGTNMPFFTAIQRTRDANAFNSSGTSGESGTAPPGVLAQQTNNFTSTLAGGHVITTVSEFEPRTRRLRPSQLMPRHVPGPKYDNIYIGPYSGSESDKDNEENMDRSVKSRKR